MNSSDPRRVELAHFLKSLRERCSPAAFGFADSKRRRTSGLRREEVAQLAGISPTWYTWIEQARAVSMSVDVLNRLAGALRMERSQRVYLFEMAGKRDPVQGAPEHGAGAPVLHALTGRFSDPAYVLGRNWDLLAWNDAARALFSGWLDVETTPNLLRYVFLDAQARQMVVDWEVRARRLAAEFRTDSSMHLDDPAVRSLIEELSAGSEEFREFWRRHDVLERQGGSRAFQHPQRGLLHYQQMTLLLEQEPVKLVLLLAE